LTLHLVFSHVQPIWVDAESRAVKVAVPVSSFEEMGAKFEPEAQELGVYVGNGSATSPTTPALRALT